MNALKLTLCAALAAGLSACVLPPDNGRDDGYRRDDRPRRDDGRTHGEWRDDSRRDERRDSVPATPGNGSFRCDNGMNARVEYLGQDRIRIAVDTIGSATVLNRAVSGSGERYASKQGFYNHATEWHEKGGDAVFSFTDPYGNRVDTSCQSSRR